MNMKKILYFFIAVIAGLWSPLTAKCETATVISGDLSFTIDLDTRTASVKANSTDIVQADIPSSIDYAGTAYPVTEISVYAFAGCRGLTTVAIPASVTAIGTHAFENCTALTEVTIPCSVGSNAFDNCTKLAKVTFTDSSSDIEIGEQAFYQLKNLTDVTLSNSVTKIGAHAFYSCYSLKYLTIPASVTEIGYFAFAGWKLSDVTFNAENCRDSEHKNAVWAVFTAVMKFTFGDNVKRIPGYLLYGTTVYEPISIPNSVTEIGAYAFYKFRGEEDITIPASVTKINEGAFSNCSNLRQVEIPNSVTAIGAHAFEKCTALTEVTIPCSVGSNAFYNCTKLAKVTFTDSTSDIEIGTDAFRFCNNLTDVTLSNSVTKISSGAFFCGVTEITIPNSVTEMEEAFSTLDIVRAESLQGWLGINFADAKANPIYNAKSLYVGEELMRRMVIPDGTTRINAYAFANCTSLLTVDIPASVTSVGDKAFYGCSNLQRLIFPSEAGLMGINYDSEASFLTYGNDAQLYVGSNPYVRPKTLTIPASITSIPDYAFYKWTDLESVKLHDNIQSIGKYAFGGCSNLTEVRIPDATTEIGEHAFYNCINLSDTNLPNSLTVINPYTFYGCRNLKSINIHGSVTEIGQEAFAYSGLTELAIPSSMTEIGTAVFSYCSGLTEVTIPNSVTEIGARAFYECKGLKYVSIPGSVTSIGSEAFMGVNMQTVVRIDDVNAYARIHFADNNANPISWAGSFIVGTGSEPVKHLVIEDVEHISDFAFYNADCIERVRLKNVGMVGKLAFGECSNLSDICIEAGEIGQQAFFNYEVSNIKNIYVTNVKPPVAPDDAFGNYTNVNLYVPQGCVPVYANAEHCWWKFLDIFTYDFADIDTLFAPDYTNNSGSGIHDIGVEPDHDAPVEYYDLRGIRVADCHLAPGFYIKRQGGKTTKILVR